MIRCSRRRFIGCGSKSCQSVFADSLSRTRDSHCRPAPDECKRIVRFFVYALSHTIRMYSSGFPAAFVGGLLHHLHELESVRDAQLSEQAVTVSVDRMDAEVQ